MSELVSAQTVIAFDPGQITGYALRRKTGQLESGQLAPYFGPDGVRVLLTKYMPDVVIVEQFQGPIRSKFFDPTPFEVIGVIKDWVYFAQIGPSVRLIFQMPAVAKHYYTDARLKQEGLYHKGARHAMDAIRHLRHFETFGNKAIR